MQDYWLALLPFLVFNVVGIGVVFLSHWNPWRRDLNPFRHYATIIFNVCGIIYALFLGFVIWDVWERYYDIRMTVSEEAQQLTDLARDSMVFPDTGEESMQSAIRNYLAYVIEEEWLLMSHQSHFAKGSQLADRIWSSYYAYTPQNEQEGAWYDEALDKLNGFSRARMIRLFNVETSVGTYRWIVLLLGGVVLLTIPFFFRVESFWFRLVLLLFLGNLVAFMLFIVYALDHPFSGWEAISPYPYKYALQAIKPW